MATRSRKRREAAPVVLDPVRPNVGTQAWYRRQMDEFIEAMQRSVLRELKIAYRANEPKITDLAEDEIPTLSLQREIRRLATRWNKEFRRLSDRLGPEFARRNRANADSAFRDRFARAGFTVRFQPTPAMTDVTAATVAENVSLIRSIPQQYFTQVEGIVMRSVQQGRDLAYLSDQLRQRLRVEKNRAALIARDQNEKATSTFNRVRMMELGVDKAMWKHSHAGKVPRPTHVKMNNQVYDVAKGMWDEDEKAWIHPGQLINCRCTSRAIIEGFS